MTTAGRAAVSRRPVLLDGALTYLPATAIGVAFVGTRLALLWRFPPFFDESLYASWALRVHDSASDRFVALANGKLPMTSWLGAGSVFAGAAPLTAVRLVSIGAGIVSLVMAALLAAELGGRRAAIGAAATYTLLPLALVHDTVGLMEPLVGALLVLALYLQVRFAREPAWTAPLLLGLVFGAGLLTKETSLLALLLFPFSLVVFDWRGPHLGRRLAIWVSGALLATLLAGVIRLILALSDLWPDYHHVQSTFGTFRSLHAGLAHPLRWLAAAWPGYRPELVGYISLPLAAVALAGAVVALRRSPRLSSLILAWPLTLFAVDVLFLTDPFVRYLVPGAPFVAIFAGVGFARLVDLAPRLWPAKLAFPAAAIVIVALCASAVWFDARVLANPSTAPYPGLSRVEYETGWAAGTGWRELVDVLRNDARGRGAVVTFYGRTSEALPLLLRGDASISVIEPSDPAASSAAFVVQDGDPLPSAAGDWTLRAVWRFVRPHDGTPIVLYRRGVMWKGRFIADPDELRTRLGLADRRFDAFLAGHPRLQAWYLAMSAQEVGTGA